MMGLEIDGGVFIYEDGMLTVEGERSQAVDIHPRSSNPASPL